MTIEATLGRIAVALEAIANSKALPVSGSSETKTPESKVGSAPKTETVAGQKTRPGKKVEEEKVETITEDHPDFLPDEPEKIVNEEAHLKWADVNKELLAHCTAVSEAKGRPVAQDLYSTFKTKYANGEKLTEATVKPGLYRALLEEVRELAAEFEAANG